MSPTVCGALSFEPHMGAVRGQEQAAEAQHSLSGRSEGEQSHPIYTEGKVLISLDSGE